MLLSAASSVAHDCQHESAAVHASAERQGSGERVFAGTALSVAPLLGSAPAIDQAHARWLHLHVRPHARGLAKTVRVCSLVARS